MFSFEITRAVAFLFLFSYKFLSLSHRRQSYSYNLNQQIFVENSAVAGKPTNTVCSNWHRKRGCG
jgi:hypothetical protein